MNRLLVIVKPSEGIESFGIESGEGVHFIFESRQAILVRAGSVCSH